MTWPVQEAYYAIAAGAAITLSFWILEEGRSVVGPLLGWTDVGCRAVRVAAHFWLLGGALGLGMPPYLISGQLAPVTVQDLPTIACWVAYFWVILRSVSFAAQLIRVRIRLRDAKESNVDS